MHVQIVYIFFNLKKTIFKSKVSEHLLLSRAEDTSVLLKIHLPKLGKAFIEKYLPTNMWADMEIIRYVSRNLQNKQSL